MTNNIYKLTYFELKNRIAILNSQHIKLCKCIEHLENEVKRREVKQQTDLFINSRKNIRPKHFLPSDYD